MIPIEYFRTVQNQKGLPTMRDAEIEDAKASLRDELPTSVHYDVCKRNGVEQKFVITPSEFYHKYEIEALPNEDLFVGDEIEFKDEHWIVVKTRVGSPFQTIGLMWLCNYHFRWQNNSPAVIERWGVLDSGVYSTTRDGDGDLVTPDKQFKIYFPKDDDTKKLYIDKRLACEVIYDKRGDEILNVYRITGYDSVSTSYGRNGHLLVLNARSDDYVASRDSIPEMICDYITPDTEPDHPTESWDGVVTGSQTLRIGRSRTYSANFDVGTWSVDTELAGITLTANGNTATLEADKDEDLLGEVVTVSAQDAQNRSASIKVEVIE